MSIDQNAVMDALGVALAVVGGLRIYDYPPESVAAPAAVVNYPADVRQATYGPPATATDMAVFPVHVVVGRTSDRAARDAIGAYMASSGPSSVSAALEADPTLGGVVKCLAVQRYGSYEEISIGQVEYLAATFDVEVYA